MNLQEQRRRLEEMQRSLQRRGNGDHRRSIKEYHHELSAVDNHPADVASEDYLRNLDVSYAENDKLILERIEQALGRLEHGEYETCSRCGSRISSDRLQALPYATTCRDCAPGWPHDPGVSQDYPHRGDFHWPVFKQFGTSSAPGEDSQD